MVKNSRIKILHIVYSLTVAGAEVALYNYIKALGTARYDHYVYFLGVDGPIREKIEALGVPVIRSKKRGALKNPAVYFVNHLLIIIQLLKLIRKNHIQAIIAQTRIPSQLAVPIAKLTGKPVFPTVHSTMAFKDSRSRLDPRKHLNTLANVLIYRFSECVLAVSPEIKRIIQQNFKLPDSKIAILKNGIVTDNNPSIAQPLICEFPEARNKLKLISVGRLVPLKGFDVLIKALAIVAQKKEFDFCAFIVGSGQDRPRLERLISTLDAGTYVKLLGFREDVIALMRGADLLIMPSFYEGLSIAMIEAMSCGLPVIASDAPGLRCHVKHYHNGVLFPTGDYKALADCISSLAKSPKSIKALSENAKMTFEQEYDMKANIKDLETLVHRYASSC